MLFYLENQRLQPETTILVGFGTSLAARKQGPHALAQVLEWEWAPEPLVRPINPRAHLDRLIWGNTEAA